MNTFTFIVASLAVWRLSYILVREKGPRDIFVRFRARLGASQKRSGGLFDMFSCVRCLSVWIGLVGALFVSESVLQWLAYGLGFSAVASLLDMLLAKKPNSLPVVTPPTANDKVLVRRSASPIQRDNVVSHPDPTNRLATVKAPSSLSR